MVNDVRRAYFYAKASRNIYVQLPPEDSKPGYVGRLNKAMYGTRDAAANWERRYCDHLETVGFVRGLSSPCVFYHPVTSIRLVVHGDDFTFLAPASQTQWCKDSMTQECEIKMRGVLGGDKTDDKDCAS